MRIIKGKIIRHEKQKDLTPFVKFEDEDFLCSLPAALHMKFGISEDPLDTEVFLRGFYGEDIGVEKPKEYGFNTSVTMEYNKLSDAYKAGQSAGIEAKFVKNELLITEYDD
ncbi:hypothetical protein HY837_06580 [archaeon]|nr:hypothetical protein [archaeon]